MTPATFVVLVEHVSIMTALVNRLHHGIIPDCAVARAYTGHAGTRRSDPCLARPAIHLEIDKLLQLFAHILAAICVYLLTMVAIPLHVVDADHVNSPWPRDLRLVEPVLHQLTHDHVILGNCACLAASFALAAAALNAALDGRAPMWLAIVLLAASFVGDVCGGSPELPACDALLIVASPLCIGQDHLEVLASVRSVCSAAAAAAAVCPSATSHGGPRSTDPLSPATCQRSSTPSSLCLVSGLGSCP